MGRFAKIDELCGSEGGHVLAAIGSAASFAERLIQIGSMFAGRDPDAGAGVLGVQGGSACDLADVANGIFMGGGVPVESFPSCGSEIGAGAGFRVGGGFRFGSGSGVGGADEDGDVLGVEKVTVGA